MTADPDRERGVRRADVTGYVFVLWGLTFLFDSSGWIFSGELTPATVATVLLSVCLVGSGLYLFTAPDAYPNGTEPASTLLRAVAVLMTVLFAVLVADAAGVLP